MVVAEEEEMGGKKICEWVVILCEVIVLFSFRAGRVFSFHFFFQLLCIYDTQQR